MKKKFLASYPAEPLTPETMPSHRLLALVHQSISKSHWNWIPWNYRMSLHKEDGLQSTRSSKVPKIENLHLHNILMDEVPSIDISNTTMGLHALRVTFDVYNNAVALCEGAHLANLKAYPMKFMGLLTTRYDVESGLRSPTITETQNADKMIAGIMQDLINDRGWSHDQALHEMTICGRSSPCIFNLVPAWPSRTSSMTRSPSRGPPIRGEARDQKGVANPRRKKKAKEREKPLGFQISTSMESGSRCVFVINQENAVSQIAVLFTHVHIQNQTPIIPDLSIQTMEKQPIEQIENSASSKVPPQMDLTFEESQIDGTFCPPTAPATDTVPRSPSNHMALNLESIVSTAGSRIFLDLGAGYQRPLSSSLRKIYCDVCTFDILVHPES